MFPYRIEIERIERAKINNRRFNTLGRQLFGSIQRIMKLARIGYDNQIFASTAHRSLTPFKRVGIKIDLFLAGIERLVLDKDDRIRFCQALAQQMIGILHGGRHDKPQARRMHDPCFKALRMLCTRRTACAALRAQHHRHADLATKHIADFGCLIG